MKFNHRYEDMKFNHRENIKKLAQFIGHPISKLEEEEGVVDKINHLCSFESLSSQARNKNKTIKEIAPVLSVSNDMFFRKGEVGDHKNYLTPSMIERLEKITNEKLANSGLRL